MRKFQVSSAQLRAARALLGISSEELAEMSGVGWATIRRFDRATGLPVSRGGTIERITQTLEEAGIEFIGDPIESPGVRLRRDRTRGDQTTP